MRKGPFRRLEKVSLKEIRHSLERDICNTHDKQRISLCLSYEFIRETNHLIEKWEMDISSTVQRRGNPDRLSKILNFSHRKGTTNENRQKALSHTADGSRNHYILFGETIWKSLLNLKACVPLD